jgi:hypothetical protein
MPREACERDEFRTPCSPEGLKVVQITSDPKRDSSAFYIDCPSWTPDSKRFVFRREAPDGGLGKPGVWLCDTEDGFAIRPICEFDGIEDFGNPGSTPEASYDCILSPDGTCAYHLRRVGKTCEIRRVCLETLRQETVCSAPAPLRIRGATAMSADGERLLMGAFLGDGRTEGAPWGAYIFDVRRGTHRVIEFGNGYRNMHCQYSHNPDPAHSHDILLNASLPKLSDGSWLTPPDGSWRWKDLPPEVDRGGGAYTVVRDDGTNWRMVPVGRVPEMINGGHNTWRGMTDSVVTSAYHQTPGRWRAPLLEATPLPVASEEELWLGQRHPKAKWVDLTRRVARADSCHFGFDASGRHFVSDTDGYATAQYSFVYVGTYFEPEGEAPLVRTRYLLLPRTSWKTQPAHPHPFLSPDGRFAVIQSDFTGRPQVAVAYDFQYP